MNENLPQKYKENIFSKIFRKIKLIFFKEKQNEQEVCVNNINSKEKIKDKEEFVQQIKVTEMIKDTEFEKKELMEKLTENPKLLQEFSKEKLEKILQYYLDENDKKIEKLKKMVS